jgi:hypothetical protein
VLKYVQNHNKVISSQQENILILNVQGSEGDVGGYKGGWPPKQELSETNDDRDI